MADANPAENANPAAPATEGGKKKIAGKFDTIEQAVEEGYVGLEKQFHTVNENVSKLTRLMEQALTAPAPIGSRGRDDDGYRRGPAEDDDIDPAKFLVNPREFLDKRDAKLAKTIVTHVVDLVGNMNAVNQFKADNPDLAKHEKVVQAFMADTDKSKPTSERLSDAGKAAREYLKSLKVDLNADRRNRAPNGDEYVEGPANTGPVRQPVTQDLDADGEEGLVKYIQDRNAELSSHFSAPKK